MLNYIANTVTKNGLKVFSRLDTKQYEKGIKISKKQMEELNIEYVEDWEDAGWNYIIRPQEPETRAA